MELDIVAKRKKRKSTIKSKRNKPRRHGSRIFPRRMLDIEKYCVFVRYAARIDFNRFIWTPLIKNLPFSEHEATRCKLPHSGHIVADEQDRATASRHVM